MNSNIASVFSNLELLDQRCLDHMSFCADDKLVEDIDATGHIDRHIREAIQLGVNVVDAWRMATWNPAVSSKFSLRDRSATQVLSLSLQRYYRIDHLVGSVTPGRLADILVLPSLEDARSVMSFLQAFVYAYPFLFYCQTESSYRFWRDCGSRKYRSVR